MVPQRLYRKILHPSLLQLLIFQGKGKLRRLSGAFRSRRKILLSVSAILLGCIWLGQTAMSVFLREPTEPESLKLWLSVSLLLYCLFNMVKIGCRKPTEPFEWTEAEKQNLLAAPLTRTHLVSYRLISYFAATAAKSLCFAIVMIPDLDSVVAGYVGMFLGLAMIDLIRMLLEQVAWVASSVGKRCWLFARSAMLIPAISLIGYALFQTAWSPDFQTAIESPNPLSIPQFFLGAVGEILRHPIVNWLMVPWAAVVETALTNVYGLGLMLRIVALFTVQIGLSLLVYRADFQSTAWLKQVELRRKRAVETFVVQSRSKSCRKVKPPVGFGGAKAVFWQQMRGAIHYRSTIAFALLIPTILSCMPLLSRTTGLTTSLSIVGSIVFYSFLLLPPALMLDFRRDVKRLPLWKASPIRPVALTLGQLGTPVVFMCLFQVLVLSIAIFVGGHSVLMFLALPILLPLNFLIIGMENAIFLAHPYRRNQEGFEVFLRTILTFTGKGVLFALGLVFVLLWAWASIYLGKQFSSPMAGASFFGAGVIVALVLLAWISVKLCSKLFERLDVSMDLPAS